MARSKSSGRWLREHFNDPYVKDSKKQGYRSRAAYKLLELDKKDRLFKPGMTVLDLGAAPGGWSQVAAQRVGNNGRVIASDILTMDSIAGVEFIQGDFSEKLVLAQLLTALQGKAVDLVLSDMAPNLSGMHSVDQPKSIYLAELALDMAQNHLNPAGAFVVKLFQGEGCDELIASLRRIFDTVKLRKPDASRARSSEIYAICDGLR